MIWGEKPHYFRKHPYLPTSTNATLDILNLWLSWLLCRLPHTPLQTTGCVCHAPQKHGKNDVFLAVSEYLSFGLGSWRCSFRQRLGFDAPMPLDGVWKPWKSPTVKKNGGSFWINDKRPLLKKWWFGNQPRKNGGWMVVGLYTLDHCSNRCKVFGSCGCITIFSGGDQLVVMISPPSPPKKNACQQNKAWQKKHARALLMSHDM